MAQARKRMVIVTLDTIAELIKDYVGESNIPADARAYRLLTNPQERGKLAIDLTSLSIPRDAKDMFVNFDIKRVFSV